MTNEQKLTTAFIHTEGCASGGCRRFVLAQSGGACIVLDSETSEIASGSPVSLDHDHVTAWARAYNAAQSRIGYGGVATRADASGHFHAERQAQWARGGAA